MKSNVAVTLLALGFLVGCQSPIPTAPLPTERPVQAGYRVAHLNGSNRQQTANYLASLWQWWWGRLHQAPSPAPTATPRPLLSVTTGLSLECAEDGWDTATVVVEPVGGSEPPRSLTLLAGTDLLALADGTRQAAGALIPDLAPGKYVWTVSLWQGGPEGTLVGETRQELVLADGETNLALKVDKVPGLGLSDLSATSGAPGDTITLKGHGFSQLGKQDLVTLGGQPAEVLEASNNELKVTIPALEPGTYAWWVQVGGAMVGKAGFQVTAP